MTIDELIVSILLDSSGFTKGAKDTTAAAEKMASGLTSAAERGEKAQTGSHRRIGQSATKMGGDIATANKQASDSFETVLRTGLAFLAMFTGARTVEAFTSRMVALNASVGRLAHNVGSTPERVSALAMAVQRSGGTFEGATSAVQGLSDAYQELITTGSNGIMEPLSRLQALGGHSITLGNDWHKTLLQVADDLKVLDKTNPQLADELGRKILGDPATVNLAKGGSEAILAAEARSQQHGLITKEQTEAAQKAQASWADLSQSVTSFGNTLVTTLEPDITEFVGWMDKLIDANKDWIATDIKKDVEDFAAMIRDHRDDIEQFGAKLQDLASAAGQIATAFASGSPMAMAMEAFIALMGVRVLGAITSVGTAMSTLSGMPAPAWMLLNPATGLPLLAAGAVAATLASGDPQKAMLDGGVPDANPRQNDLGLPGMDSDKDLPENKSPSDPADARNKATGFWDMVKQTAKSWGFGDALLKKARTKDDNVRGENPKVQDDIADIAKSTAKTAELLKGQQDAANTAGVTTSSGGLGGSGRHFGGGSSPGASLGDRSGGHGSAAASGATAVAKDLTPEARAFLDTTASGESPGYNVMNGGGTFGSYADHPGGRAAGRYQFLPSTWRGIKKETGLKDFSPESQDKGAWYLARRDYRLHTGRDLQTDLASKDPARIAEIGRALSSTWVSFNSSFARKYQNYLARNGTAPSAQAPVPAGTSSAAVTDAEVFAARQRLAAGGSAQKDKDVVARYLQQQSAPVKTAPTADDGAITTVDRRDPRFAPKAPRHPTVGEVGIDLMKALHNARKMTHHDGTPVKVSFDGTSADHIRNSVWNGIGRDHLPHVAAMLASAHRGVTPTTNTTNNTDNSSETHIAALHVHSRATDAAGIARDTHAALIARREAAEKGNYGLA